MYDILYMTVRSSVYDILYLYMSFFPLPHFKCLQTLFWPSMNYILAFYLQYLTFYVQLFGLTLYL